MVTSLNRSFNYHPLSIAEHVVKVELFRDNSLALDSRPDFAETLNNRGAAYEALHEEEKALREYMNALTNAPGFAVAYYNVARLYSKRGNIVQCLDYLEKAVELQPQLADEAADDENLGWVMELNQLKVSRNRELGEGRD